MDYNVVNDADTIDGQFGSLSPFNLKKDIKDISDIQLKDIADDVANDLKYGPHGDTYNILYTSKENSQINFSKVRCEDHERKRGKSNGYRCIVLVDNESHYGFILHIYRHGHGENKNISTSDKNALKKLVETYVKDKKKKLN